MGGASGCAATGPFFSWSFRRSLLLTFIYLPLAANVIAFQDYAPFIGISNSPVRGAGQLRAAIRHPAFWQATRNTLEITAMQLALFFPIPIALALLLNSIFSTAVRRSIQTVVYLPHFISWVIIVALFQQVLGGAGVINQFLRTQYAGAFDVMTNPDLFSLLITTQVIWKDAGWGTIIFLAALGTIDQQQYESAAVDGAGRWRRLWHVTLPGIRPVIVLLLILRLGEALTVGGSTMTRRPTTPTMSRRTLLKGSRLAGSAAAMGPRLTACGGDSNSGSSQTKAADLPAYKALSQLTPDLPGTRDGVQHGFLKYPSELFDSVDGTPLSGGSVSALVITYASPPPDLGTNKYWQAVNERLGGKIEPTLTPATDYFTKFATRHVRHECSDLVLVPLFNRPVSRLPELLQSRFSDLNEQLSGDAVLDFRNLANLPTSAWKNVMFDGRIYGIPIERPIFSNPMFYRADIFDSLGVQWPTDADGFLALCRELTSESDDRWALGSHDGMLSCYNFSATFGVPNNWRLEDDGSLTKDLETDEFAAAVEFMSKLWEAGVFHPDAAVMTVPEAKDALASGRIMMVDDGLAAWKGFYDQYRGDNPDLRVGAGAPISHDGSEPAFYLGRGAFGFTAIAQGDAGRIGELLSVVDFLSAPFGSTEHLLLRYGVEGHDFDFDAQGNPALNDVGRSELATYLQYLGTGPDVLYHGTYPDWVEDQHAWEKTAVPMGLADPTVGAYSNTHGRQAATLDQKIHDTVLAIVQGRSSMDDLETLVTTWRNEGGDQMREEFQEALA